MEDRLRIEEQSPGEYDVWPGDRRVHVVVPAGVGVPGVPEEELVVLLVTTLVERGHELPEVLDVSHQLGSDPTLFREIAERADR
jgi:hypothetical protein